MVVERAATAPASSWPRPLFAAGRWHSLGSQFGQRGLPVGRSQGRIQRQALSSQARLNRSRPVLFRWRLAERTPSTQKGFQQGPGVKMRLGVQAAARSNVVGRCAWHQVVHEGITGPQSKPITGPLAQQRDVGNAARFSTSTVWSGTKQGLVECRNQRRAHHRRQTSGYGNQPRRRMPVSSASKAGFSVAVCSPSRQRPGAMANGLSMMARRALIRRDVVGRHSAGCLTRGAYTATRALPTRGAVQLVAHGRVRGKQLTFAAASGVQMACARTRNAVLRKSPARTPSTPSSEVPDIRPM